VRAVALALVLAGCDKLLGLGDITPRDASPDTPPDAPNPNMVVQVVAGGGTTCARLYGGNIWCWGNGGTGELGDGMFASSSVPVQVVSPEKFTGMDTADAGACAFDARGALLCWGNNRNGCLGYGTTIANALPTAVMGIAGVDEVAVGYDVTCARHLGAIGCAGRGGLLGDGMMTDSSTFVPALGISDAISLTTGDSFTCALLQNGSTWCWGDNTTGELGQPATTMLQTSPMPGPSGPYVALTAGDLFACGLMVSGEIECWGDDSAGQLGDGNMTTTPQPVPLRVVGISDATAIAGIAYTTCALRADKTVWCWGSGGNGELGDGNLMPHNSLSPVPVSGLSNVVQLSARNGAYACALLGDASVWCWGAGSSGQLGNGFTSNSASPVRVQGLPP
jgi:alpha-tubulin suppressor-like RCC1 family protein